MQNKIDVVHLTSVHPRLDSRILFKECRSLSAAGFLVSLIVADGKGDTEIDGVKIYDVGYVSGRVRRMLITSRRVLKRALALDAQVYHLHDPELLLIAGSLVRAGKTVIFDAHEDVPVQIRGKPHIHRWLRPLLSRLYGAFESSVARRLDAVVTATPFIRDKFLKVNPDSVDINNFPIPDELASQRDGRDRSRHRVCYIGSISVSRGIREIVRAINIVDSNAELVLCGKFEDEQVRKEVETFEGWRRVDAVGWLGRNEIRDVLSRCVAGLVTLHPKENYVDALPVKMFEYMSAGLPVICSNFPLWKNIVKESDCGVCVDPEKPEEIAAAIDFLVRNPTRATEMGENGREAIERRYNWPAEEKKLIELYEQLTG
jgi:glycosyltransferase involved in cell wall biosynthesis